MDVPGAETPPRLHVPVTVDVTSNAGSKVNTTGNVSSTSGGTGNTGTDTLTSSNQIPIGSRWRLMLLALLLAAAAAWRLGAR